MDVVNLNLTLSAAAEALTGLGTRFGHSLTEANAVLNEVNPRLPQLRKGVRSLTELADIVTRAGPELLDGLDNATTTARTLGTQQGDLDAALLATIGFAGTATDTVTRGAPPLIRATGDLLATSRLLDTYSPEIFCTIRNTAELVPLALSSFGGNGYSLATTTLVLGAPNPYVYPENLPRVNARGGPGGRRVAGRRSPAISGRRRIWLPTPGLPSRRTTTSNLVSRCSSSTSGAVRSARTPSTHESGIAVWTRPVRT